MRLAAFCLSHLVRLAFMLATPLMLVGCMAKTSPFTASSSAVAPRLEGARLVVTSIHGPENDARQRFAEHLAREAKARGFAIAEPGQPATRLEAHLDAFKTADGKTGIAWMFQTSEDGRIRTARTNGSLATTSAGTSGWSALDDQTMRRIAASGLDDLTRVLTAPAAASADPE